MTKEDCVGYSRRGLSRRSPLQSMVALLRVLFVAKATAAWAQDKLAGSGEVVAQDDAEHATKRPDSKTNADHVQERRPVWRAQ